MQEFRESGGTCGIRNSLRRSVYGKKCSRVRSFIDQESDIALSAVTDGIVDMKFSLIVVQGKPEGVEIPLKGPQFSIGRDAKCNLRPNNDLISKVHCAFQVSSEKLVLKDMGSTNGTHVNNERLNGSVELKDGDLVKVGPLVFAVKAVSSKPVKAAAPAAKGDDPMEWLMSDANGNPAEPSSDSTVMDLPVTRLPSAEDTQVLDASTQQTAETPALTDAEIAAMKAAKKPNPAPPSDADKKRDTREAASDILNRYMVRRRGNP